MGERVKTDARDALHVAKLLKLDEIVTVTIPSENQEAARDLVRAREDARRDLMSARHRLGKLLLRRGVTYPGKTTWSHAHHDWLRQRRFELPGLQAAFDAAHEAVVAVQDRRDRLDAAILAMANESEFAGVTQRLSCLRGISTLTAFALAVEIGDWSRLDGRRIGSYPPSTPRASRAPKGASPTPGTPMRAVCWSKPPGITGRPIRPPRRPCGRAGRWRAQQRASARIRAACGCTAVGGRSRRAASAGSWRTPPSPASSLVGAGRWR